MLPQHLLWEELRILDLHPRTLSRLRHALHLSPSTGKSQIVLGIKYPLAVYSTGRGVWENRERCVACPPHIAVF